MTLVILLFLHLVWPIVRVDDAWYGQLLSSLLLSCSLELPIPLLQEQVCRVVS